MTRSKFEFPTEWSLYPEAPQEDSERPPLETNTEDPQVETAGPRTQPLVLAAGAAAPFLR